MKLNLPTFTLMLKERCAFYGMTAFPLTEGEVQALHSGDVSIDDAYGVACDVSCGVEFWESVTYMADVQVAAVLA